MIRHYDMDGNPGDEINCVRWSTRAEAEQGHAAAVTKLRGVR